MSDLEHRIKQSLEPVLELPDPRQRISASHDMPYATALPASCLILRTLNVSSSPGPLPITMTSTPALLSKAAVSWFRPSWLKLPGMLFIAPVRTGIFFAASRSASIHASDPPPIMILRS